jgi:hypothetical protein
MAAQWRRVAFIDDVRIESSALERRRAGRVTWGGCIAEGRTGAMAYVEAVLVTVGDR